MSSSQSQRELLFARVHKHRMADSLSRNLSKLAGTEERMSSSRLSSASSSSLQSLRRAYSTVSHNPKKSSSKEKMLKEIIQKLREAKLGRQSEEILPESPSRQRIESESKPSRDMRNSRVNKLQEMMKDIKKCNQMSTKAVYSIKKNVNEQLSAPQKTENPQKNTSVILLVNELAALKQQLASIKQENKQLLNIIQQQKEKPCPHCNMQP